MYNMVVIKYVHIYYWSDA